MFLIEDSRLIACKDLKTEQVNIPATVSTIGAKAFANHDRLTMLVFLPRSKQSVMPPLRTVPLLRILPFKMD